MRKWEYSMGKRAEMLQARRERDMFEWAYEKPKTYVAKRCRVTMRPTYKCGCKDCTAERVYEKLEAE